MEARELINLSYEEAVLEKSKYSSDIIIENGAEHFLMITPNEVRERNKFLSFISQNFILYTDTLRKSYSSDAKYQVRVHLLTALHN